VIVLAGLNRNVVYWVCLLESWNPLAAELASKVKRARRFNNTEDRVLPRLRIL
jgi:hypothetical protein